VSEQPAEAQPPLVHLQVTEAGEIFVDLPDRDSGVAVTIELTPKSARELGEALWKAGTNAEPSAPDTGQHPAP
jgi:hypothetical protein